MEFEFAGQTYRTKGYSHNISKGTLFFDPGGHLIQADMDHHGMTRQFLVVEQVRQKHLQGTVVYEETGEVEIPLNHRYYLRNGDVWSGKTLDNWARESYLKVLRPVEILPE